MSLFFKKRHRQVSDKIKIFFIIGTLDIGGTEKQLAELVMSLDKSRFDIVVCCLSHGGPLISKLLDAGIRVEVIGFRGFRHNNRGYIRDLPLILSLLSQLVSLIKKEQPHILHGFLFWAYILGAYTAKIAGIPIIIASRRSLSNFKGDKWHYKLMERLANRFTELIIANSDAVKQDTLCQEKLDPSKVMTIYNGIDPTLYDDQPAPGFRASLNIPEKTKVIGMVANLIHYKGHKFFIRACARIKSMYADVIFLLIGEGPMRIELEKLTRELGLEDDVVFLGRRSDVPLLLSIMDIFVLTSLEEGFSNAILEAMAAGKPVIATDVGGNSEAVIHGETGLLVPSMDSNSLADAINNMLCEPEMAEKMGRLAEKELQGNSA